MKSTHVLFGRHLLNCGIQEEGRWCSVLALNVLSVSCTALLPGTLEEGQGEGSLDLDCVGYSFHLQQVWKYPRRAALFSLVVWEFQSPDLSANIRPAKGHAPCTVSTSWSPYTFPGRCITCMLKPLFDPFFVNYYCLCFLGNGKVIFQVSWFCWCIWTSRRRVWEWTFGIIIVTWDYETHDWTLLPAKEKKVLGFRVGRQKSS